jgi:hypothetical protein
MRARCTRLLYGERKAAVDTGFGQHAKNSREIAIGGVTNFDHGHTRIFPLAATCAGTRREIFGMNAK